MPCCSEFFIPDIEKGNTNGYNLFFTHKIIIDSKNFEKKKDKEREMRSHRKRFWAEIDMNAATHNFNVIRAHIAPETRLCCVVKANAYGHGAVPLSKLYNRLGADFFAVSNIEEAMQLRRGGINGKILILGYTSPDCAALLAQYGISQTVFSMEYAEHLEKAAAEAGVSVEIHVKLDTGMNRLGFPCMGKQDLEALLRLKTMRRLIPEGVFTHFAMADCGTEGQTYTEKQQHMFSRAVTYLAAHGLTFSIHHSANSAALTDYVSYGMDMVRAGIVLYGHLSSDALRMSLPLRSVMSLRAVISMVKEIKRGECVSYGCTFCAPRDMRIATIPVGYADGYLRSNAEGGSCVLVHGKRAPIVGRICMDQLMLDVTDISDAKTDDVVTIMGSDGDEAISAEELAVRNRTIPYEVLCGVGERVPRFYLLNGEIVYVKDNIVGDSVANE